VPAAIWTGATSSAAAIQGNGRWTYGRAACGTVRLAGGRTARYSAPAAEISISISINTGDGGSSSPLPFGWDGRSVAGHSGRRKVQLGEQA
jgi:hypothetical protein